MKEIIERNVRSVAILDLEGTLGFNDGEMLKEKIHGLLLQGRTQIVLNLARVAHVDSSGLGALLETTVTARHHGARITLVNVTRRLHDLLSITKLLTVFASFDSESEAVNSSSKSI